MPRLAARPVSPSAAMASLAFVPSEINERLGTKAKLPRSLDNMEERPYWKWEVGCPHAEDCAKSQNSWSKIWKVSFESPEKLLEKIMWHLHKSPLHGFAYDYAEAVVQDFVLKHPDSVKEYWETHADREQGRDWRAENGEPDDSVQGADLDNVPRSFGPPTQPKLPPPQRVPVRRAWPSTGEGAQPDEEFAPISEGEGDEEDECTQSDLTALMCMPRRVRTPDGSLELVDAVRSVMAEIVACKKQAGLDDVVLPKAKVRKLLKAGHSTLKMLDQISQVATTMQKMAGAEAAVLRKNIDSIEDAIRDQDLGL